MWTSSVPRSQSGRRACGVAANAADALGHSGQLDAAAGSQRAPSLPTDTTASARRRRREREVCWPFRRLDDVGRVRVRRPAASSQQVPAAPPLPGGAAARQWRAPWRSRSAGGGRARARWLVSAPTGDVPPGSRSMRNAPRSPSRKRGLVGSVTKPRMDPCGASAGVRCSSGPALGAVMRRVGMRRPGHGDRAAIGHEQVQGRVRLGPSAGRGAERYLRVHERLRQRRASGRPP